MSSTYSWLSGSAGTWSTAADWTLTGGPPDGGFPQPGDTAIINSGSVHFTGANLNLGGSDAGPGGSPGTVTIAAFGQLEIDANLNIWQGSALSVDATSGIDIGTSGTYVTGAINLETNNVIAGNGVVHAPVANNGIIDATNNATPALSNGGKLEIQGTVSGAGVMNIEPGATLQLDATIGSTQTINFVAGGAPETLILGEPPGTISAIINGFTEGDKIEFSNGIVVNSAPVVTNGNTVTVSVHNSNGVNGSYVFTDLNLAPGTPAAFWFGQDPQTNDQLFSPTRFFTWTPTVTADLGVASNWNDLTDAQNPSLVVPGPTDWENFNNAAGGTLTGSTTVDLANFFGTGTWTLASGADVVARDYLTVGRVNAGNLTVGNGATASSGGQIDIGIFSGTSGTLTVSSGGVVRDTAPPNPTNYQMYIGTAGASGTLAPSTGTVFVTGALLDLGLNGVEIGNNSGSGMVLVSQGGTFIAGVNDSNLNNSMAIGRTGHGTVVVTDNGSKVEAVGIAYIAHSQTGALTVENAATFLAAADPTGLAGLIVGDGSTNGVGGIGTGTVTTDGILISQGYVLVGDHGTQGELTVSNGGTVEVGTSLVVGNTGTVGNTILAGNGTVTIDAGSTIELTGTPSTASYGVIIGTGNSDLGTTNLGTGDVVLSGAGALLSTNGNAIAVGLHTNAILNIGTGATVETGTPNSVDIAALSVGRQGHGSVIVDGGTLLASGGIYIGRAGTGDLLVENAGSVHVGLDGTGSTSDASLSIGGAGIANGTLLYVGGTGTMEVTTGATVASLLSVDVGHDGTNGELSINSGGMLETNRRVHIGSSTTLIAGGTLISSSGNTVVAVGTPEFGNGSVTVATNGLLKIDANGLAAGTPGLVLGTADGVLATLDVATGGTVIAGGGLAIWQGSTVSVAPGGAIDVGGTGTISAGAINVDTGFAFVGDGLVQASVLNNQGTIVASNGGTLELSGSVIDVGVLEMNAGNTLRVDGAIGSSQSIMFDSGSPATLILGTPGSGLSDAISGLALGDRIEFAGLSISAAAVTSPGTVTVNTPGGDYLLTDVSFAPGTPTTFGVGTDSATGDSYIQVACFAAGTRIATPHGDVAVESLRVGDKVRVISHGRTAPVVWIGNRDIDCTRHPHPHQIWPIRIRAGAFGDKTPHRDLFLSPDHAVLIDDVLIPISYLINGTTISQVPTDAVTYYHIELPAHDVLLAEGLPTESYLDTGTRANFANAGRLISLHPDFSSRAWEAEGCAPLVVTGPELDVIRERVNAFAAGAMARSGSKDARAA